jgi:3-hydroxyacyl-CoA dehydrogenase
MTNTGVLLFDSAHTRCARDGDVAILTFIQPTPRISADILDALHRALDIAERDRLPLVIASAAEHFAMGADLDAELAAAADGNTEALERTLARYQRTMLRLRHASVPTVAALRGAAISGGCEVVMHCARVVANPFSGIGLGEASIGVVPGGGGVKEFALRATHTSDLPAAIDAAFDVIANGRIARGVDDALALGFLEAATLIRADDHVASAVRVGLALIADFRPPAPNPRFGIAGPDVKKRLIELQRGRLEHGEITAHQFEVNSLIAWVICGGDAPGLYRDEADLLAYERAKFRELVAMPLTQARIAHLVATGEILRN